MPIMPNGSRRRHNVRERSRAIVLPRLRATRRRARRRGEATAIHSRTCIEGRLVSDDLSGESGKQLIERIILERSFGDGDRRNVRAVLTEAGRAGSPSQPRRSAALQARSFTRSMHSRRRQRVRVIDFDRCDETAPLSPHTSASRRAAQPFHDHFRHRLHQNAQAAARQSRHRRHDLTRMGRGGHMAGRALCGSARSRAPLLCAGTAGGQSSALGQILESSSVTRVAAANGTSALAGRLLGHTVKTRRELFREMGIRAYQSGPPWPCLDRGGLAMGRRNSSAGMARPVTGGRRFVGAGTWRAPLRRR